MSAGPALAPDAAMVLGIASTAMPFARTSEDDAERWLRVLRLHGEVGAALQALGVSEGSLRSTGESEAGWAPAAARRRSRRGRTGRSSTPSASPIGAAPRGVATTDVLLAVMDVYGADFERVLRAHGTDRDEVIERLGAM